MATSPATAAPGACDGAVAAAADIICSLRAADLAGWTPPWCRAGEEEEARELIWPAVARGKRSRPRRGSPAAAAKGRWARASPASPLDYSGGSSSGASTSGWEDGGSCSPPAATAAGHRQVGPAPATKVGPTARRTPVLPSPPPRPGGQQRSRKKMRLPEVQQLVRSLTAENEGLREEMQALQRACTALSKENCKLESRLEQPSERNGITSEEQKGKQQLDQHSLTQSAEDSFILPDLNLPAQETTDGSMP